jgi:type I restriction enzyme R subunit
VMDALSAHTAMSKQALESESRRRDKKYVLLGAGNQWEGLREKSSGNSPRP